MEFEKSLLYHSRLNWYIGLIMLRSLSTKKRAAAIFAHGLKAPRVSLILFIASSA